MSQTKGRILLSLTGWDPGVWLRELERAAPDRETVLAPENECDPSIHYAVVWKPQPGVLTKLPNLKAIFSLGAGVDHVMGVPDLPDVPVVRVVSSDLTARMSEYIVWQVLDHHRLGPLYRSQQQARIWEEDRDQKAASAITVGMMGLGELGRDAAMKLAPLGFRLTGWSRTQRRVPGMTCFSGADGFAPFLASADIFVVLLPLTPDTAGILNRACFAKMRRDTAFGGPVLINAGRGGLQVEDDILEALDNGQLSAVTLDVFQQEPLPPESPFWSNPKVTITPHAAAASMPTSLIGSMVAQMEAHDGGAALSNVVDRATGY